MTAHEWFSNFKCLKLGTAFILLYFEKMYHKFYWKITTFCTPNFRRFAEQFEKHILLHGELCFSYDLYMGRDTLNVLRPHSWHYENASGGNDLYGCQLALPRSCSSLMGQFCAHLLFPLGMTKERGGPLPLILNLPSSSSRIPFSPACSGFNNILWG